MFHRDIKPTNILYAKDQDRFILIDFNVASDASNTEYAGTGPYIAPDLASSSHEVNYNESGDPFALGTTIYQSLIHI